MQELNRLYQQRFEKVGFAVEDVVYQCQFDEGEDYQLAIFANSLAVQPGSPHTPTLTLYFTDEQVPQRIAEGELDPMQAFLDGKFRASSHLLLVMQYLMLFGPLSPAADLR